MFQHVQKLQVSLAHRYWNPSWDLAENQRVYGTSASSEGVGSNFAIELVVKSESATPPPELAEATLQIKNLLDHRCLFLDTPEFKSQASTLERIAVFVGTRVFAMPVDRGQWQSLQILENASWSARVLADSGGVLLDLNHRNLTVTVSGPISSTTGVLMSRTEMLSAVDSVFQSMADEKFATEGEWSETLRRRLEVKVKGLAGLIVDLGRQKKIIVNTGA